MKQYNLQRFIKAQNDCFDIVYEEMKNGKKESHWMWYIFPQIHGLGKSWTSVYYSINDINEAKAYLQNDTLKERLVSLLEVINNLETNDPLQIFGHIDDQKFWSSITLFHQANPNEQAFKKALDKFFGGIQDQATLEILERQKHESNSN